MEFKGLIKNVVLSALVVTPLAGVAYQPDNLEDKYRINESELQPFPEEKLELLNEIEPQRTISICKNQRVPNGWVIIAESTNFSCPGRWDNQWTIKKPGRQENVCKASKIPSNYVIVAERTDFSCPGRWDNSWTIKIPGRTETICKSSRVPNGYVIVSERTDFSCPGRWDNAWVIERL